MYYFEVQYKASQGITCFLFAIKENIRKFKKKIQKQINSQPILKEKFLLHYFLAMQIMGQPIVNIIYMKVNVLCPTERIKALFMKMLEGDCI